MDFKLGIEKEYTLSEGSLNHIINGDISERHDKNEGGKPFLTKILSGGLHTLDAWNTFLDYRPEIKHALLFEPRNMETWYYTRELQNGVILLKIPRECFQSQAAKITLFPETFYKWKKR